MNETKKTYAVFSTREYEKDGERKTYWMRLGSAFKNKDDSFNILLKALPLADPNTGLVHLHIRLPKDSAEQASSEDDFFLEMDPIFGAPLEAL